MGTAIYVRVSTGKQQEEGISLETQQERILAYCEMKGLKNIKKYIDVGSARDTNRTDYQKMMNDVEKGLISNVVIYKLDRLNRSNLDLLKMIEHLKKHNCGFNLTIDNIDTSSSTGKLQLNMLGAFAEHESNTISESVSDNMMTLATKGIWMSSVPYGFDLSPEKRLVINEDEAKLFRKACSLILNKGYSFLGAYKYMADNYGVDWSPDFLLKKINHETTVGNIMRNGIITYNTHEPLISIEDRDKLLEIRKSNHTGRARNTYNDIFRRKIKCYQCKSTLVLNVTRRRKNKTYYYSYQCSDCYRRGRKSVSVSEPVLERSLIKYMSNLSLSGFQSVEIKQNDNEKKYAELKLKLDKINRKRDRIQRAWINEKMSDNDLEKYSREIDREEQTIKEEMDVMGIAKRELSIEELSNLKLMFQDAYEDLTRNEKLEFIQKHFKEIHFKRTKLDGHYKYRVDLTDVIFF